MYDVIDDPKNNPFNENPTILQTVRPSGRSRASAGSVPPWLWLWIAYLEKLPWWVKQQRQRLCLTSVALRLAVGLGIFEVRQCLQPAARPYLKPIQEYFLNCWWKNWDKEKNGSALRNHLFTSDLEFFILTCIVFPKPGVKGSFGWTFVRAALPKIFVTC